MDSTELPPTNERFAALADESTPKLNEVTERPLGLVRAKPDANALLGFSTESAGSVEDMKPMLERDSVIIDFGGHRTGYFQFTLRPHKGGREPADSPCRLRLIFGEVITDVAESFEPYEGWLSKAWLPDEILNVDYLPQEVRVARRHAFRYVKVEVIAVSRRFAVTLVDPVAIAVTSAPSEYPAELSFREAGRSFKDDLKVRLRKIDRAGMLTLKNCMQTVYEDGPRRDRRLWIGDLRLQALTAYSTFKTADLAKRCLYLFAATPFESNGRLSASCYEKPSIASGGQTIADFNQMYIAAVLDYVEFTGDLETGRTLYPIALKQVELALEYCDSKSGLYVPNYLIEGEKNPPGALWHFIDWQPSLDKDLASHAIVIFGARSLLQLAKKLSLDPPQLRAPFSASPVTLDEIITTLRTAARKHCFDSTKGVFTSGKEKQVSWASQAWAILAGIHDSESEGAHALKTALEDPTSPKAVTPYLHHYVCEAMIKVGLDDMALHHISDYWGSMIDAGGETFWEIWDPKNPRFSPYGDLHANSFCHAWSCTPSLLLRRIGFA